jgi:hypothetical protein
MYTVGLIDQAAWQSSGKGSAASTDSGSSSRVNGLLKFLLLLIVFLIPAGERAAVNLLKAWADSAKKVLMLGR